MLVRLLYDRDITMVMRSYIICIVLLISRNYYLEPPFRPASRARSLPGSKEPLEAWPPMDAISRWHELALRVKYSVDVSTHLLVCVHAGEATVVAGLATFRSDLLNLFLRPMNRVRCISTAKLLCVWD